MSQDMLLTEVLARIETWYLAHVPVECVALRSGITEHELTMLEETAGFRLPEAFNTLYRWHDGEEWNGSGVFRLDFMPLAEAATQLLSQRQSVQTFGPEGDTAVSQPGQAIRGGFYNEAWFPLLHDGGGNFVGLDFAPGPAGMVGQIITFGRDEQHNYVLADSLDAFLREYWARLDAGWVTVVNHDDEYWSVELHDSAGRHKSEYFVLAELFPNFGVAPGILEAPPS